jgi:transcriptional regulator with XRE-family HTH domain
MDAMRDDDWIGLRVARWRDIAGLRQEDVAARCGVSREYISMIENGHKAVVKRSLLIKLAEALNVSVADLTARPVTAQTADERAIHDAVPNIRGALDGMRDEAPRALDDLRGESDKAMRARMACDYAELARLLPDLIGDTQMLADRTDEALSVFAEVCFTASMSLKPLGYTDLAMRLAERAQWAAERSADAATLAAADFARAQACLAGGVHGLRARSLLIAGRAADRIQTDTTEAGRAWYGMLHLHASMSAASLGRSDDATAHLREAEDVAEVVHGDPWRMEFSKANVGVWRVGIALENGDAGNAPAYARRVNASELKTVHRRARLLIDAGRGLHLAGDTERAIRTFLEADRISSAEVRTRTTVREIVGEMVRDARRKAGSDELRTLAARVGFDPLAPEPGV